MTKDIKKSTEESMLRFINNVSAELKHDRLEPIELTEWQKKIIARNLGTLIRSINDLIADNFIDLINDIREASDEILEK